MLQQHGHYVVFVFLNQEGGETEYPFKPVAAGERISGRHTHVVQASKCGHSTILAAASHLVDL